MIDKNQIQPLTKEERDKIVRAAMIAMEIPNTKTIPGRKAVDVLEITITLTEEEEAKKDD